MKKLTIFLFTLLFLIVSATISVSAATGYRGYAIYRDGVNYGIGSDWHAGIMDEPYSNMYLPVIHITNGEQVSYVSWNGFINGNSFMGVYEPIGGISSLKRDDVHSIARLLRSENIEYTVLGQINYSSSSLTWIYPDDITSMRCDGVVEYSYEFNEVRIYGDNDRWNIALNKTANKDHHSLFRITPISQANNYMQKYVPPKNVQTDGITSGKIFNIQSVHSGKYVGVVGAGTNNGTEIQQFSNPNTNNMKWQIVYLGNGDYTIKDMNSLKLLSIPGSMPGVGYHAWIWVNDGTNGQKFNIRRNLDGSYTFLSKCSNYTHVLDISLYPNNGMDDGNVLHQYYDNGTANQKFKLFQLN